MQSQTLLADELTNVENALRLLGGHVVKSVDGVVSLPKIADHALRQPPTATVSWSMDRAVC